MSEARQPGLDTLRAAAILMVIPFHAWLLLGGPFVGNTVKNVVMHGWAGVELFFVLSGFLICSQLIRGVASEGRLNFRRFYLKRSLRILPSYYVVILLYAVWPAFREKTDFDPPWRFFLFVMNYGRQFDSFSHAWSLCVEEHFYLLFPTILALCLWRPKLFPPKLMIGGVLVGEILVRFYLWQNNAKFFTAVYRPSHTHLDGLTIGIALALLREIRGTLWLKAVSRPWPLFVSGLVLVGIGMWMYKNLENPFCYALTFTVESAGFGALLVAALAPGFWLSRMHIPGAAQIATLAFTLYLTHKQMIHMAMEIVGDYKDSPAQTVSLAVVLVIAAAMVLHLAVERPMLKLRDRMTAA